MNNLFEEIRVRDIYLVVADQIRQAILSGKIKPGEKLPPERELARMFGVSRIAVREALRSLEAVQFLEKKLGPRGGAYVRLPGSDHIKNSISSMFILGQISFEELARTWQILEPPIAELAAENATPSDLADLEQAVLEVEGLPYGAIKNIEVSKFHNLVARASRNRVLALISESTRVLLTEQVVKIQPPESHLERIIQLHKDILEAIKNRDPKRAYQKMLEDTLETAKLRDIVEAGLSVALGRS